MRGIQSTSARSICRLAKLSSQLRVYNLQTFFFQKIQFDNNAMSI